MSLITLINRLTGRPDPFPYLKSTNPGAADVTVINPNSEPIPVNIVGGSAGGGGGGTAVAATDLLYTDATGQQFIYRDNGATPPVFTAYTVPGGVPYTVGANPQPYEVKNVAISNLPATQPVSAAALPLPAGAAADGTDGTGIVAPAGATGIRGWLSGIYKLLSNALTVNVSALPAIPAGANNIGTVGLASGATVNVAGITAPTDLSTNFTFTAAGQSATLNTNDAAVGAIQMTSNSNSIVQVYGSLDGTTWLGPLHLASVWAGYQYWNGGDTTAAQDPVMIYKFDCGQYQAVKVQCYSFGGTCQGTLRVNGASTMLLNSQPLWLEGTRETSSFSAVIPVTADGIILTSDVTNGYLRIHEIDIRGFSNTASPALVTYKLSRWYNSGSSTETGGTGGTAITQTPHVPSDGFAFPATDGGSTVKFQVWTTAPTLAATESVFRNGQLFCPSLSSPTYDAGGDRVSYESTSIKAISIPANYAFSLAITNLTPSANVSLLVNIKCAMINGL